MKGVVREAAADDLDDILDWISKDSRSLPFLSKVLRTVQSAEGRRVDATGLEPASHTP
jgi:hypothetical protein